MLNWKSGTVPKIVDFQNDIATVKPSQRGRKVPDLLIAAAAEAQRLTVLHYDQDFDKIAKVTGQRCEWVVPAGSVVVAGSLPSGEGGCALYCAVIVKQVDAKTRSKTSINELLRA